VQKGPQNVPAEQLTQYRASFPAGQTKGPIVNKSAALVVKAVILQSAVEIELQAILDAGAPKNIDEARDLQHRAKSMARIAGEWAELLRDQAGEAASNG
jgi:DNA-binding phage protein